MTRVPIRCVILLKSCYLGQQCQEKVVELMKNARAKNVSLETSMFVNCADFPSCHSRGLLSRSRYASKIFPVHKKPLLKPVAFQQELELFARGVTLIEAEHNMQSKDFTDLGDDPKFMNDPVSTGMRLQYGNPQFFKEEFVQEFFSWLARDTKTRIFQALPTDDQYYFLKRQAKGNLRQYVIWVFIHDQWLDVTGNQPELYWRSKHFAEEDYEAEMGILVKEKWDLR